MAREPSPEIDDELFNEVYGKEYTGPVTANNLSPERNIHKRPLDRSISDNEEGPLDPNAVPTDFTSREAKVWEAKAKATERNWKKRKEEEMICKLCGDSGHFTQGCPSTLGANRKSADFFERVPARDKRVRDLFSQRVISQIERDVGCKIKMDEKFLIVSGRDRLKLAKGVDAVHKLIQEDKGKSRSPSAPNRTRSRSREMSPQDSHARRSSSQVSHGQRTTSQFSNRSFSQERSSQNCIREDVKISARGSSPAFPKYGAQANSTRSRSPRCTGFSDDPLKSYQPEDRNSAMHKPNSWDAHGIDSLPDHKFDVPTYPQTLEELEMEFQRETMEMCRSRDQAEDEEINKHRELIREMRENYAKKLVVLRATHAKQREEFLRHFMQRHQQPPPSAYGQHTYTDYDATSMHSAEATLPTDRRNEYNYPVDPHSAPRRNNDTYNEFHHHQRPEDYGKTFGRY